MIFSCVIITGPSILQVIIMINIVNLSVVVQWDEVDDSLTTTYTVTWTSERDHITHSVTLIEQSSYTITGLTLDTRTVYTITVSASNKCGQGPEYKARVSFPTGSYHTLLSFSIVGNLIVTYV